MGLVLAENPGDPATAELLVVLVEERRAVVVAGGAANAPFSIGKITRREDALRAVNAAADYALYEAKEGGRNRVVVSEAPPVS